MIHAASMEILAEVGIKVSYKTAREQFQQAGAHVDDESDAVKIPGQLVLWVIDQAPAHFIFNGRDPEFTPTINIEQAIPMFAGLGTPTRIIDMDTNEVRETTHKDVLEHIILINACINIHNSQMDVWPNDI